MHLSVYILFQCLLNNPDKDIPESFSNSVCGVEKEFAAHSTDLFSFCRFPQLLKQHRLVILYVSGVLATAEMHLFSQKHNVFLAFKPENTLQYTKNCSAPRIGSSGTRAKRCTRLSAEEIAVIWGYQATFGTTQKSCLVGPEPLQTRCHSFSDDVVTSLSGEKRWFERESQGSCVCEKRTAISELRKG